MSEATTSKRTKDIMSDEDWCWLYWFLGCGTGVAVKDSRSPERNQLICERSARVMNNINLLRARLEQTDPT